jgi:glycosyltransferase involved in cell wall biosynthesis
VDVGSRPFHIGLNAHLLTLSQNYRGAGINSYIRQLLRHLTLVDRQNRYTAFLSDPRFTAGDNMHLNISWLPTIHPPARIFWEQFIQPLALIDQKIDLLHAMAFVAPLLAPCPTVVTIYDLSFIHFPELFRSWNRLYLSRLTAISARQAQRIIAISDSTKRDVVSCFGVPAHRVDVVHCGVDETFRPLPRQEVEAFRARHGLPEQFILFLGTLEPRKNIETLIRAYAQLRARCQGMKATVPRLVIGGAKGWYYERIFKAVEELDLTRYVIFPGYITQEELPWWYNAATFFVYPSSYEGFGLPVLEAMASGTPVITTNASSLPEVVGQAGLLLEPMDADGLAESMYRLLWDATLREELSQNGLARASRFSWERTARETVAVYLHVLNSGER